MSDNLVNIRNFGCVAVLTLNVPQRRNVLSKALVDSMVAAIDEVESQSTTQVLVVTGAGSAFCAGAELDTLRASADGNFDQVKGVYNGFLRVLNSPLVTIAAVNGAAVGAGMNLVLACDIRLGGTSAVFDCRFSQLRIHPGGGHLWMLSRAVGEQQALLACLFGEVWTAAEAQTKGLLAAVYPDDELLDGAISSGRRLDKQEVAYTRRVLRTARLAKSMLLHEEALAEETDAQQWSTTRPAFRDGVDLIEAQVRAKSAASQVPQRSRDRIVTTDSPTE